MVLNKKDEAMKFLSRKNTELLRNDYLYLNDGVLSNKTELQNALSSVNPQNDFYVFFHINRMEKQEQALAEVLQALKEKNSSSNVSFYCLYDSENPEYNNMNLKYMQNLHNNIAQTFESPLLFPIVSYYSKAERQEIWKTAEAWEFPQVLKANLTLNDIASEILRQGLSPYERFLAAYSWASSFRYKAEEEGERSYISRSVINVLSGDKIVCVGFAKLLETMCDRLGIPCALTNETYPDAGHLRAMVRIDDDKYNIHGVYFTDPTFGARKSDVEHEKDYFHYLTPMNLSLTKDGKIPADDYAYRLVKNMNCKESTLKNMLQNNVYLDGYAYYDYLCEKGFFKGPYLPYERTVEQLKVRKKELSQMKGYQEPQVLQELEQSTQSTIVRMQEQNLKQITELQLAINNTKFVTLDKFQPALTEVMCNLNLNYYEGDVKTQQVAKRFVNEIIDFTAKKHASAFHDPNIQNQTTFSDCSFFSFQPASEQEK